MTRRVSAEVVGLGLALSLALAGCLDSVVGGECRPGWTPVGGVCRELAEVPDGPADVDAGTGDVVTAGGDGGVCEAEQSWCGVCVDLGSDPDHCGRCGHGCPSGLCAAGACLGAVSGHVVLIGHDYRSFHAASARVLANAVGLGLHPVVRVRPWGAAADPMTAAAVVQALTAGMSATGRPWLLAEPAAGPPAAGGEDDVFLVLPPRADADAVRALGWSWRSALAAFVAAGGVVIVVDGPGGSAAEVLRGGGLLEVGPRREVTGGAAEVIAADDALAIGVPSPYLAAAGTVAFEIVPDSGRAVIATSGSGAVVLHRAVP